MAADYLGQHNAVANVPHLPWKEKKGITALHTKCKGKYRGLKCLSRAIRSTRVEPADNLLLRKSSYSLQHL